MPQLTSTTSVQEAQAIASAAEQMLAAYNKVKEVLKHNSDLSHDWTNVTCPSYIIEDEVGGNMTSLNYTRIDIGNTVYTLDEFRKLMENLAAATDNHIGNLNSVSRPSITRVRVNT